MVIILDSPGVEDPAQVRVTLCPALKEKLLLVVQRLELNPPRVTLEGLIGFATKVTESPALKEILSALEF